MAYFCIVDYEEIDKLKPEELCELMHHLAQKMQRIDRNDLLLRAITVPTLERLQIEAARAKLSSLLITKDFRFLLSDYNREVMLTPLQKALYILFLNHTEGIEFKCMIDHREELLRLYRTIAPTVEKEKAEEAISRLTDPTDNAINEKCSKIKAAFGGMMDSYTLSYYMISGHAVRMFSSSRRVWFKRLKVITLPRELVKMDCFCGESNEV